MFHLFHQCFNNVCKCLCLFVISFLDGSSSTLSSVSFRFGKKSNLFPVIKCDGVNTFLYVRGRLLIMHSISASNVFGSLTVTLEFFGVFFKRLFTVLCKRSYMALNHGALQYVAPFDPLCSKRLVPFSMFENIV